MWELNVKNIEQLQDLFNWTQIQTNIYSRFCSENGHINRQIYEPGELRLYVCLRRRRRNEREEMKQRERDGFGFISYIFIVRDLVLAIWQQLVEGAVSSSDSLSLSLSLFLCSWLCDVVPFMLPALFAFELCSSHQLPNICGWYVGPFFTNQLSC